MNTLVEVTGLATLLEARGIHPDIENFESFYSDLASTAANEPLILEIQEKIRSYFSSLQISENPTIYDYLLLTLRKKDVIATFNWDPLLAQAHERNINIGNIPEIFYLHGNVGIGICLEHHMRGFIWQDWMKCARPLTPMELLFPVRDKNYTDEPFITHQWQQLELYLQNAYWITIFGYSAPVTDVAARDLMLQVWRTNSVRDFAQIEIVDIKTKSELRKTWSDFIVRENYGSYGSAFQTYMFSYPRRSCDAFAGATLQQRPWKENKVPKFRKLTELQAWVSPLVTEENKYRDEKIPFADNLIISNPTTH